MLAGEECAIIIAQEKKSTTGKEKCSVQITIGLWKIFREGAAINLRTLLETVDWEPGIWRAYVQVLEEYTLEKGA